MDLSLALLTCVTLGRPALPSYEAPFRIVHGDLYVEARIGELTGWFMLDSGSFVSWLDPKVAEKLAGSRRVETVPATDEEQLLEVPTLEIGGAKLPHVLFETQERPLPDAPTIDGNARLCGLIGYNALRMLSMAVDFDQARIWFWGAGRSVEAEREFLPVDADLVSMPLSSAGEQLPDTQIEINGIPWIVTVDTGSLLTSIVDARRSLGSDCCLYGGTMRGFAWGAAQSYTCVYADTLTFPGVQEITPTIWSSKTSDPGPTLGWASLGALHRVLFDFDGSQVVYERPKRPIPAYASWLLANGVATTATDRLTQIGVVEHPWPHPVAVDDLVTAGWAPARLLFAGPEVDFKARSTAMRTAVDPGRDETEIVVRGAPGGRATTLVASQDDPIVGPGALPPPIADDEAAGAWFADGPGTYFWKPGVRPIRCGAGTLQLPPGSGWIVASIGGVPQPTRSKPDTYEIPDTGYVWGRVYLAPDEADRMNALKPPYVPTLPSGAKRTYRADGSVLDQFEGNVTLTWHLPIQDSFIHEPWIGQLPVLCIRNARIPAELPPGVTFTRLSDGSGWLLPRGWTLGSDGAPVPPATSPP